MTRLRLHRLACLCAALAATGAGIIGCGQKGPLYLPGESPERVEPGIPAGQTGGAEPEEEPEEEPREEDDDAGGQ